MNEEENRILNEKVRKSGLNKSEFFRKIILDYQLKEKPDEKFYETLSQLRGMATNLNQMSRVYNQYKGYVNENKYATLYNQIQNFILSLEEVYLIPQKSKMLVGGNKIWKVKDRLDITIDYAINRRKDRRKIICIRYKLYA